MNNISVSLFVLALIKLQEFCFKHGIEDFKEFASMLYSSCSLDGNDTIDLPIFISDIRNSEPFLSFDLYQEMFVYEVFKNLK